MRLLKINIRRAAKWLAVLILLLLCLPPIQVGLAAWRNPSFNPMQWQRTMEARRASRALAATPQGWTPLDQIPVEFIHFVWASEDQNYFTHRGFDFAQMKQSVEEAKKKQKAVRGSSTITMQCARSVFLWQQRSYVRKALEAYYTFWMETLLSKRRILELYLNNIELGPGIYGIGAAAQFYFHCTPRELTRDQMIALAAILPNPLKWSPVHPDDTVQKKIRRIERLARQAPFPRERLSGK
ncbi:monofunctional biosynthetic peptidoglycan transglycosylase [soil metagenome]